MMKATAAICIGVCVLGACTPLLGPAPKRDMFVIELPACTPAPTPAGGAVLLLRGTTAGKLFDSQKIVYSETPDTRGFYQFAAWAETPIRQLNTLLLDRLQCRGIFRWITRGHEPVLADYALSTELVDFRHDYREKPGKAVVELRAELYDLKERKLLASKVASSEVPVERFNAEGAVRALNRASDALLNDIVAWVSGAVPQGYPQR